MADEGNSFTGFLYAGVMINDEGIPKVLEYNVRFGDPETQPIMMRLKSDLVQHCLDAIDGELQAGMVLTVESYVGPRSPDGADTWAEGVKLENQVLVTANGPELLTQFPLDLQPTL